MYTCRHGRKHKKWFDFGDKVRIILDFLTITGRNAGLQSYAKELVRSLAMTDLEPEYILLVNSRAKAFFCMQEKNFKIVDVRTPKRFIGFWEQLYLPVISLLYKADILHTPVSAPPLWARCKKVVTLHDLTFKLQPQTMNWWDRLYWNFFFDKGLKGVNKIITDSWSTARDITKYYCISRKKISIIPLCCASQFHINACNQPPAKIIKKYGISGKYILFVGTLEPRKNLGTLLRAFRLVKSRSDYDLKLVIVGGKGWLFKNIFQIIKGLGLENDVIFTGFVPDEDLPSLYRGAEVFVYPSLYEGFGLPLLEAMTCGTPVIASKHSSIPEVVGNAGILVDPKDVERLARAILEVLTNKHLKDELIYKGCLQASKFTAEKMGHEIIRVYKEIAGRS